LSQRTTVLDLDTDVLGKLLRAEVGLLELRDELIDLGWVASATALDVMHPRPSSDSRHDGNHVVHRTLTMQNPMGPPMDAPPKVNIPGAKGAWQSPLMSRSQDY